MSREEKNENFHKIVVLITQEASTYQKDCIENIYDLNKHIFYVWRHYDVISFFDHDIYICDRTTALDIKSEKSILVLLHILIVDIMKIVFPKFDYSRAKIGFLTNF